jgi:hypothetical protein
MLIVVPGCIRRHQSHSTHDLLSRKLLLQIPVTSYARKYNSYTNVPHHHTRRHSTTSYRRKYSTDYQAPRMSDTEEHWTIFEQLIAATRTLSLARSSPDPRTVTVAYQCPNAFAIINTASSTDYHAVSEANCSNHHCSRAST